MLSSTFILVFKSNLYIFINKNIFFKVVNETDYVRDGQRVLECLRKAIKIASQCMEDVVQITLYVHILADYFYFYEENCDSVLFVLLKL